MIPGFEIPNEERKYGPAEVVPDKFLTAINDIVAESNALDQEFDFGIAERCKELQEQMAEVIKEVT